jgi:NTP pyrophosphatase (non-canonical NTP hydrolase)
MNIKDFQKQTQITANKECSHDLRIINSIFGLNGETGELTDMFKKHFFQGHILDTLKIKLELGDILYYFCDLLELLNLDIEDIAEMNNEKLKSRYPNGFETERSVNRNET